jgi:uncharacterized SAM-binding protein YcdF (DUF218 family)
LLLSFWVFELAKMIKLTRSRLLGLGFIALLLWPLLAWSMSRLLIVRTGPETADAIAVFSGSATYKERTGKAGLLFKQGVAPLIILTNDGQRGGWSREQRRNPRFVELAQSLLEQSGVPRDRIVIAPTEVDSTFTEANAVKEFAQLNSIRSLVFVTSAYHSRRALWTVRRVFDGSGIEVGIQPVEPGDQTPGEWTWWLTSKGWQFVAGEWVKYGYYHLAY